MAYIDQCAPEDSGYSLQVRIANLLKCVGANPSQFDTEELSTHYWGHIVEEVLSRTDFTVPAQAVSSSKDGHANDEAQKKTFTKKLRALDINNCPVKNP